VFLLGAPPPLPALPRNYLVPLPGPSDEQYEQLLEILKNRLEDGLGECVYEVNVSYSPLMAVFFRLLHNMKYPDVHIDTDYKLAHESWVAWD
jgi:hypothetical protein